MPSLVSLLDRYFTAINQHSYYGYIALFTPQAQQGQTPVTFSQGFASTSDSKEMLTAISVAADGRTVATVTFISHQNVADSANHAACTSWRISLFLRRSGTGYLIGKPPAGYRASYGSCP